MAIKKRGMPTKPTDKGIKKKWTITKHKIKKTIKRVKKLMLT